MRRIRSHFVPVVLSNAIVVPDLGGHFWFPTGDFAGNSIVVLDFGVRFWLEPLFFATVPHFQPVRWSTNLVFAGNAIVVLDFGVHFCIDPLFLRQTPSFFRKASTYMYEVNNEGV